MKTYRPGFCSRWRRRKARSSGKCAGAWGAPAAAVNRFGPEALGPKAATPGVGPLAESRPLRTMGPSVAKKSPA
jgi:hypothetical protein